MEERNPLGHPTILEQFESLTKLVKPCQNLSNLVMFGDVSASMFLQDFQTSQTNDFENFWSPKKKGSPDSNPCSIRVARLESLFD